MYADINNSCGGGVHAYDTRHIPGSIARETLDDTMMILSPCVYPLAPSLLIIQDINLDSRPHLYFYFFSLHPCFWELCIF